LYFCICIIVEEDDDDEGLSNEDDEVDYSCNWDIYLGLLVPYYIAHVFVALVDVDVSK